MRYLSPFRSEWGWPQKEWSNELMEDFLSDFDRAVSSFMRPAYNAQVSWQPSCDVTETKDHYLISFDMPGVKKEDIKVEVDGNTLTVSGERHKEVKKDEEENFLRHEKFYGKYQRSFTLPPTVDTSHIEAHYEDGVLNIAIPKAEKAKGRKIEVQSGKGGLFSKLLGVKKKEDEEKEIKAS